MPRVTPNPIRNSDMKIGVLWLFIHNFKWLRLIQNLSSPCSPCCRCCTVQMRCCLLPPAPLLCIIQMIHESWSVHIRFLSFSYC